jgi:hypothetical protein
MSKKKKNPGLLPIIGWRETVALPDLTVPHIKAKVDTGARSSSLHAFDLKTFQKDGQDWCQFEIHPNQRNSRDEVVVEVPVLEYRRVRSSNGTSSMRPVILTHVALLGFTWEIELTLANRDEMGFRMLLGREALRGRFLVDSGGSFYGEKTNEKAIKELFK